jgi:3-oxoacyl-[acyl-carrier protein] reductase
MIITPNLNGKVALVTGASRGIGAAIAVALAEAGAAVAVNYRERADAANALVADLNKAGMRAIAIAADVSQASHVSKMVERVSSALGPVDILVNNAGIAIVRDVDNLTEADFDRTITVNLKSTFLCTQAVLAAMRAKKWGRIVNITSGAARGAGAIGPHYNASKAGMEGLTRGYAARLVKDARPARPSRGGGACGADGARQRLHDRTDHHPQWRHGVHLAIASNRRPSLLPVGIPGLSAN